MEKRIVLTALLIFLLLIVGIGGWLVTRTFNQKNASLYITGSRVIPTVDVPTPAANCDPQHIPGVTSDPAGGIGAPAIKPHLCSIPTFTEQDVQHYMDSIPSFRGLRIEQTSAHFTVTRILFVTNKTANDILNADTGVTDDNLVVCYVEVYGDFTVASPFPAKNSKPAVLHHGQMVFDGVTGNMIDMGVVP